MKRFLTLCLLALALPLPAGSPGDRASRPLVLTHVTIIDATGDRRLNATIAIVISNVPGAAGLDRARRAGITTCEMPHHSWSTRAAYDAAPHPTVRFHIAMCLERLGRLREAWTELTEVAATAALTDAQRRDAARQVDRVRAMLVTLRVEGEPAGASVRLDGVPVCVLPCEVPVDPGEHDFLQFLIAPQVPVPRPVRAGAAVRALNPPAPDPRAYRRPAGAGERFAVLEVPRGLHHPVQVGELVVEPRRDLRRRVVGVGVDVVTAAHDDVGVDGE